MSRLRDNYRRTGRRGPTRAPSTFGIPANGHLDLRITPDLVVIETKYVIPANAGIQKREHANRQDQLGSRFRGNDAVGYRYKSVDFLRPVHTKLTASNELTKARWCAHE